MIKEQNICKKCILTEGFLGVHLNSVGECDFCADPTHENINWRRREISDEARAKARADWNVVMENMQRNHGITHYDCIVGYSGGKDSTVKIELEHQ